MDRVVKLLLGIYLVGGVHGHRMPGRPQISPSVLTQILHRFGDRIPIDNATIHEEERRKNLYIDITFKYYNQSSNAFLSHSIIQQDPSYAQSRCSTSEKWALVTHGWNESCSRDWMVDLIKNLNQFRGGCIICMDYSPYSQVRNYVKLYRYFNGIQRILTLKLENLLRKGFDPNKGYVFGFSFGAQLVLRATRRLGDQIIREVDVCDPAGPGFDLLKTQIDFRGSAKNVQCIHTSQSLGTVFSNLCHQDWRLGNCGINQDAASDPPCGSHGLCPFFYNNAFKHDFIAITKPTECKATNLALVWPENYKMGYMETRKLYVTGELFAVTTATYPYNSNVTNAQPQINIIDNEYDDITLPDDLNIALDFV